MSAYDSKSCFQFKLLTESGPGHSSGDYCWPVPVLQCCPVSIIPPALHTHCPVIPPALHTHCPVIPPALHTHSIICHWNICMQIEFIAPNTDIWDLPHFFHVVVVWLSLWPMAVHSSNPCSYSVHIYIYCTRGWYIRLIMCAGSINKWTVIYSSSSCYISGFSLYSLW